MKLDMMNTRAKANQDLYLVTFTWEGKTEKHLYGVYGTSVMDICNLFDRNRIIGTLHEVRQELEAAHLNATHLSNADIFKASNG